MRTAVYLAPALSFAVTVLAARVLASGARRAGLLDVPDGIRKTHKRPVPLVGGLAIALGVLAASLLPGASRAWRLTGGDPACLAFVLAGFLLLGLWDDLREPPPLVRFALGLLLVGALLFSTRLEIRSLGPLFGGAPLALGILAVPFSLVVVLGFVNAMNFLDGLDALAAGVAGVIWLWLAVVASLGGFASFVLLAAIWLAALLAHLPFNLGLAPRVLPRIFLGDAGSLLLGAALAVFALLLHDRFRGVVGAPPSMVYAWILGYPVVDALAVMARRVVRGRNPMHPDRGHLHHLLLDRGHGRRTAALLLTAVAFLYGLVGVGGWAVLGIGDGGLFALFLTAAVVQGAGTLALERSVRASGARPLQSGG